MSATGSAGTGAGYVTNTLDIDKIGSATVNNQVIKFTFSSDEDVDLIDALSTHKTMYVVDGKLYPAASAN